MLNYLKKTFYYETWNYIIDIPKEILVQKLDVLFVEKDSIFQMPNLSGHFIRYPNSFALHPKWSEDFNNVETCSAYLIGDLSETPDGRTRLQVSVRPSLLSGIIFLLDLVFGLYNVVVFFTAPGDHYNLLAGLLFLLFALPIIIVVTRASVHSLKENLTKYLDIPY